jgi:SAM-dependent methyltransferase
VLPLAKQNAYRERYKHRRPGWRTSGELLESCVRSHLHPRVAVLDLGCGRGGVMDLYWRDVRLAVGADGDRSSLLDRPSGMRCVWSRAETLPFADETFDLVVAVWLLEHLPDPAAVWKELARVLVSASPSRPGGHVVFVTPNVRHPLVWCNRLSRIAPALQRRLIPRLYGRLAADTFPVHYHANSSAGLRALAAAHGFQVRSLEAVADPSYLTFNDFAFELAMLAETLLPPDRRIHLVGDFVKVTSV